MYHDDNRFSIPESGLIILLAIIIILVCGNINTVIRLSEEISKLQTECIEIRATLKAYSLLKEVI